MSDKLTLMEWIKATYDDLTERVEYFFAKRWLDNNFGEQEYWGERIEDLEEIEALSKEENLDRFNMEGFAQESK